MAVGAIERKSHRLLWLCAIALVVVALPNVLAIPASDHARENHSREKITPTDIRERLRGDDYELWFSASRDKVLYLVWVRGEYWGGRIIGATSLVEITCFVSKRKYWNNCIRRDGYIRVN